MEQTTGFSGNLLVAVRDTFALVKVTGRATFKLAPSLRRFCSAALGSGCEEVVFDMEECTGMDSTFMGVLAGISIRSADGTRARRVIMMNLTPKTHSMLATLGLARVLECHEAGDMPTALKQRLSDSLHLDALKEDNGINQQMSLDTMLQAHQHLVDVAPENMVRFRDVLTYLDQEIRRNEPPDS
jgi:anti-anti-sigma factor